MATQPITKNLPERIRYEMAIRNIEVLEMAVALRCSVSTFYVRLRTPTEFTLGEIETMAKKLRIPPEELLFRRPA